MFLGCADSRVSEGTVFNAKPGTMFSHRNLANQFNKADQNGLLRCLLFFFLLRLNFPCSNAVLSYAVGLGVQHFIVMGHYGCGAVRAAMVPPPAAGSHKIETSDPSVQAWIKPIRDILRTSNRYAFTSK
jgi:carbonic anhydrase